MSEPRLLPCRLRVTDLRITDYLIHVADNRGLCELMQIVSITHTMDDSLILHTKGALYMIRADFELSVLRLVTEEEAKLAGKARPRWMT